MRGYGSQWFSHKIINRHPLQLKKSKSWEPFGSYQLNSTANPAHLPQNLAKLAKSAVLFSRQLQTAPRILIFSIAMGADHSFYVKSIETHARAFLTLIILFIGTVNRQYYQLHLLCFYKILIAITLRNKYWLQTSRQKC